MSEESNEKRVQTARRAGMMFLVMIIAWTISAVTIGVLRGVFDEPATTVETPES